MGPVTENRSVFPQECVFLNVLQVTSEANTAVSFFLGLFFFHLCRDFGNWEKHTRGIGAKLLEKVRGLNAKHFCRNILLYKFSE